MFSWLVIKEELAEIVFVCILWLQNQKQFFRWMSWHMQYQCLVKEGNRPQTCHNKSTKTKIVLIILNWFKKQLTSRLSGKWLLKKSLLDQRQKKTKPNLRNTNCWNSHFVHWRIIKKVINKVFKFLFSKSFLHSFCVVWFRLSEIWWVK